MTLNLVVVAGTIRFIIHGGEEHADGAHDDTRLERRRAEYVISADDTAPYGRLTVPPGLWMAFQGLGHGHNLPLNLATHEHDPTEAESCALQVFADALPAATPDAPPTAQDARV